MSNTMAARAARANRLRQVYTLLALGVIFVLAALILRPDPYSFPAGVLLFGAGMLVAMLLYPLRLGIAGCLTTALGIAVFLTFKHIIPGNLVLAFFILAIGVGLLGIALLARQGYVGKGALSPAFIVLLVGLIELLLPLNFTPPNFVLFMLSLWLPGIGLLVVGIAYLFSNARSYSS
ncbi:MAG TPA: hypothetical protein VGU68_15900 [Ktedonobacteraceae bacterium]|nr:hypothetical protein [Ktedonobacteraceae bacterium]